MRINKVIPMILVSVACCICLSACSLPWSSGGDRSISVTELNGTATVTSADTSVTDLTKGKKLVSGDSVNVYTGGDITLLIDRDKHLTAGEDTQFSIEASGKKGSTATVIVLSEGTARISIDKTLGSKESFDVVTPNAMFSVRGTVFSVSVDPVGDGYNTELSVESGMVEASTVENDSPDTEFIGEGQSGKYTGEVPEIERWFEIAEDESDDNSAMIENRVKYLTKQESISSVDEIPEVRDGSKGFTGVFRSEFYTIVVAEDVPYAINKNYAIWVEDDIIKPFCMVEIPEDADDDEPYFPRDLEQVSDTLITDYTFDKDTKEHIDDVSYYLDGDTMYYHYIENDTGYEEFIVLTRTDEDPTELYNSCLQGANHENSKE